MLSYGPLMSLLVAPIPPTGGREGCIIFVFIICVLICLVLICLANPQWVCFKQLQLLSTSCQDRCRPENCCRLFLDHISQGCGVSCRWVVPILPESLVEFRGSGVCLLQDLSGPNMHLIMCPQFIYLLFASMRMFVI